MTTIVHVEAGKFLYGGALQVKYLLTELQAYHVNNILVCPKGSDIANECRDIAKVIEIDMKGDLDIGLAFRLKKILVEEKASLLHIHSRRGADVWGALAAKLAGVKVLLTRRVDNAEPIWFSKIKYAWFDHVAAISEGIRQVLLSQKVPADHVTTVRSAVDTELYQPRIDRAWFQSTFNYQDGDVVIGVIAQLIERKGHQLLLDKLTELRASYPNLQVLILGKGPRKEQLEASVNELGLTDCVQFAGFRTDMPKVMPNLDLVVHPAYIEGLGVSLLQAASCGVPIISCRTGGIPEAVKEGVHGLLAEPGDKEGLAKAIAQLLADKPLRESFSEAGIARMRCEFSTHVMAKGNVELYQRILNCDIATK
ncbi:glycosyltransferase [Catenovulum sp. SM1970]|uniref:glycosyltransferase n=1 Tax=Marinifaba aquimaris TaxID=2741323 RepID=UPI0015746D1E|nr:glycosyltransferase [Marinifaba aquimaris]NTS75719.1 glycosyltransferase [Marinifaba aquimaris]